VNAFGSFGNMPDSSVLKMMNELNQAFNEPTPDGVNVGLYFKLAQTDPNCRPTNGIIHVDASDDKEYASRGVHYGSFAGGISQYQLAAKSFWDNTKYLNIWIVYSFSDPGISGYAFYPTGASTKLDGIVLQGSNSIVHEMGHAFYLYHTFEGSNGTSCPINNDCMTDGDMICDTPPVLKNTTCNPLDINPCTNAPYGNYAVYNHMSYNGCRNLFTPEQRNRMLNALYTYRSSLLTSNTELAPPKAPVVSIVSDDDDYVIDKDQLVKFTPTVTGSNAIKYHWLKNNVEVSTELIYSSNRLVHGDEIVCMVEATDLVCHVPVTAYSNKIKIFADPQHFVSIYPNPTNNYITAWTPSNNINIKMIRVFATDGKLLETKLITPASNVRYSMLKLPAGLYFLEFSSDKGKEMIQAIKGQ
jgi:hypothetical protein